MGIKAKEIRAFKLNNQFRPSGDQLQAIERLEGVP
jgi:excinuclease UvrABC helicase subunit UvrB